MARVISWVIGDKYVYIEKQGNSWIMNERLSDTDTKLLGNRVIGWTETEYKNHFEAMYSAISNSSEFGGPIDMVSDYKYYFNATGGEGVYILTGRDGVDTSSQSKSPYNIQITNNNTCLGLGGDYKLDVAVTLKTYVRLEKDGEFYLPEQVVTGATGAETNWVSPATVDGYSEVSVKIAKNTDFSGNNHVKEYWIRAKKDGKEVGKVLFTVVGVKDGEEGVSYDLLVMPNQINVSADGVPTDNNVTCKVIVNGEAKQPGGELKIKYDFGPVTTDVQDIEYEYSGSIPYSTISAKGDRVNFYLLFGNNLVDYDSCVVTRDGVDGGHVTFELDNEIDGVGVGSDSKLDVTEDVHLKTGFVMYSGSTALPLKSIKISDLGTPSSAKIVTNAGREITPVNNVFNLGSATGGVLHIYLKNGFEFGEDLRDAVTIDATGETNAGEVYASTIYTILGVKGGKDGEVYKIMTSHDSIVYDPNKTPRHSYGTSAYLTAKPYIGTEEIYGGNFTMSYTIDSIKTTKTGTITYTKGSKVANLKIDKLVGGQSEDPAKYVVFYLWSGSTLIDRESVPVLGNGMNGSAVWVELSNEIDAISVGDDTDLDLEPGENVHVGTTAMIMSGATHARIARVQVIPPAGTEANWEQYVEVNQVISDDNLSAKIDLYISNGFEFGDDYREVVTISATAEDGWQGSTQYVLKGIKGGKDGYVYRVVPETDYVTYNPNTASMDFGQGQITCTAYYGKDKIGTGDFTPQAPDGLYYSINKVCETSADTASDVSHFVTGFTSYPSGGVNLGRLVTTSNYKNFKYLVFYLLVDKEIVDRETVKIVSDGLDGHDNIRIELTNEIDSIGIGTDTILDLPDGETRKMSTGVMMYSGSTKLSIRQVRAEFANDSNSDPAHSSTGWSQSNETFTVTLKNGFDFGEDLKEKVVVYVTGGTATNQVAGYATFVLAGILGGKDGVTYKIQPTPDCVMYDYETQGFPGLNLISAKAYSGGKLMEPGTFEIYYSEQVYDIDTVDLDEILIPYQNPLSFSAPVAGEDKRYVFYLKVGDVFVDRETVPLLVNGKEGRDYNGASIAPNLTDEMGVVALGNNERLEANVVLHTTYYIRNGYEKLTIGGITLPGTYTCPSGRGTIAFTSDFVAGTGQKDVDITITITASKTKYIDFARIVEGAKFNPITGFVIEGFPADVPECVLPVDYKIAGALGGEDGQTMGMVLSADQVFYDDTKVTGSRCTPTLIKAQLFLNGSDITMNSDVTFEVVSSVDASVVTGKWLSYSRKSGGFAEFNVTESKVESELIPLSIRVKKGGVVVDLESVQVVKNGKDGSGGLYSKVEPQSLFVPCEEGHPRSNYNGRVQISLWSGFTQDTIKRVTATSTYSAFGAKGASGKNVTYEVTDGDGLYKWFNVTATTAADFSNPIEIQLTFQSNTDTTLTRYGIVTLNPSEGGRGARGPMTRIRDFKSEYSYQNGSDTDAYLDIVVYYNGTGGGYYLCIKDQSAPSTAPKVKVVNGVTVVDSTDTNWQYQPEAAFTASKVATFGTWPNGWVIDAGKIQHTDSSITLDADGVVTVSEIERTYYKYKEDGGSEVLYTTKNYKDQALFKENKDGNVVTYKKLTSPVRYVYYSSDYVLSGTYSSPKLVYTENVNNSALYAYSTSSEDGFAFRISEPIARELSIETNATGYKVDTAYKLVADDPYNPDIWTTITWMVKVTPITGKFKGKITAGSSTVSTSIENVSEGSYVYSGDTGEDYLLEAINVALASSWGHVSYPSTYYPSTSDWYESPIGQWIDDKTYYYCELDAFTMKVGSDQSTTEINLETAHLYVSSGSTDSNFSGTNQFKLSQNFPSGEAIVPTSKTLSYTNSTEKVQNIPNAKINSTESGRSEEDGNIIIAAGMEKNIAIYKWANGNDVIYTLYPYNTSSFGVENGGIVPIYDSIELPLEKNGTLQYDRGYTIVRILYNGVEYEATGTLYDGSVDPIMFANTRIYANGRIVTNNLYANDGTFNGILNARGGTFNGTITATDGVMENVDVKNGMFSGDIVLRGGNTITVYDEDATIPSVTISSKDISIAPTEYSVSAGGGTISKTNSTWGKVNGTETIVLSTTNISAGSSVTIPSLKLSLDFKKKVESVSVSITYSTGGTDSSLLSVSRSDTKDHFESNSAEKTFNVSVECTLTIKMRVQYSLKSGFMGYSALYATVSPNAPMKILNNSGSGFNQVVIGKNGISYAANDATFFVKRDGTKTSIMMKVKNSSNKYNGIQIDDDEVSLFANNKKYRLYGSQQIATGQYVITWTESTQ